MDQLPDLFENMNMLVVEAAKQEIRACNQFTQKFDLSLSEEDITELVENRSEALKNSGRVEFGNGILPKLIFAFCDSPFLDQENYLDTLLELQEVFYIFKTDALDMYSDDEIIEFMSVTFNGRAQGSTEYLIGTTLEALIRYARNPYDAEDAGDLF